MAQPRIEDEVKLKRQVRYLAHHRRGVYLFRWQDQTGELKCFVDSDWTGFSRTSKSTSGGAILRGAHCLHQWSRTQSNIALSSGEAELNSALKGGAELLGCQTLMTEMSLSCYPMLFGDSSACFGTLHREGSGKVKHLHVKQLWLQSKIKSGEMTFTKIPRAQNPADSLAKSWTTDGATHFDMLNFAIASPTPHHHQNNYLEW